jgi:tetratricopeptide (TPR) repeat protein
LTLLHIGQVHQQRGELEDALKYFTEALGIQRAIMQPNDPSIAQTLNHIGNIHLQRGAAREMVEVLSEAVRIVRSAGRPENEVVLSGFNFYGLSKLHPECAPVA